jgi:GNAT superfamily N-acetyltransferase
MDQRVITTSDRTDLAEQSSAALLADWPEFILHDRCAPELMGRAWEYFPEFDVRLLEDGAVSAGGWAVPLRWNGAAGDLPDGYDGALTSALAGHRSAVAPDTMCVMAVAVHPDRQRAGLAGRVITALRDRAAQAGLRRVVVPVRPTLKSRYPLTSMADFASWARGDGLHMDPWIRTHQRLGAEILCPAPRSMIVTGTVAEWQDWAGMAFPQTGRYIVPGALDLVEIDTERDHGSYVETNLWMRHA